MNTIFTIWRKIAKLLVLICPFGIIWAIVDTSTLWIRLTIGFFLILIYGLSQYIDGEQFGENLYKNNEY